MIRTNIRTRKIGSNASSDKYIIPAPVEASFRDLALFLAHTGFTNILHQRKTVDVDIIPIFRSVQEVFHFRPNRSGTEPNITCGLSIMSLLAAWRIVSQDLLATGNQLWYISDERRFILYIYDGISVGTLGVLADEDDDRSTESPFDVAFCPEPTSISVDGVVTTHLTRYGSKDAARKLFRALSIMIPYHIKRHHISRHSIVNRVLKLNKQISADYV